MEETDEDLKQDYNDNIGLFILKAVYFVLSIAILAGIIFASYRFFREAPEGPLVIGTTEFETSGGRGCEMLPVASDGNGNAVTFCLICHSGVSCFNKIQNYEQE